MCNSLLISNMLINLAVYLGSMNIKLSTLYIQVYIQIQKINCPIHKTTTYNNIQQTKLPSVFPVTSLFQTPRRLFSSVRVAVSAKRSAARSSLIKSKPRGVMGKTQGFFNQNSWVSFQDRGQSKENMDNNTYSNIWYCNAMIILWWYYDVFKIAWVFHIIYFIIWPVFRESLFRSSLNSIQHVFVWNIWNLGDERFSFPSNMRFWNLPGWIWSHRSDSNKVVRRNWCRVDARPRMMRCRRSTALDEMYQDVAGIGNHIELHCV